MDYMQDELGREINKRIADHSKQTQKFIDDCYEYDKMFRCVPESQRKSGDGEKRTFSDTFVPEFLQDTETVVSALDALMFTEDPWLTATPDELTDSEQDKAANTQALLEKQAAGSSLFNPRLRVKMLPALRSFVINGTCIGAVPWDYRYRTVADGKDFAQKVMRDGPGFRNIPLWRFHHDPWATGIEDSTWVAEKYRTSVREVRGLIDRARGMVGAEITEPSEDLFKTGNTANTNASGYTSGETVGENMRQGRGYTLENDKRPEVIIYWGENPDMPNSPVDWRIVTVNGQTVIKMPNPYSHGLKPFVKGCFINLDESFYGLGLGAILKLPQLEMNDYRNLMRDILNFALNHPWQREGGTGQRHKDRLKLKPQMVLDLVKDGRYSPLAPNMTSLQHGMIMEEAVRNGMRATSAASAVQQGVPTDVSAREISAMGNASDRRLLSLAVVFVDNILRPVLWFWHEMNKQYHTEPQTVTVQGPTGEMTQRMIAGKRLVVDPATGMESVESDLLEQPDINIVLSVDADGRKGMIRRLTSALDNLVNVEKNLPGKVTIDFPPIIKELVRLMGIRPQNIVQRVTQQPLAMPGQAPDGSGLPPQAPGEANLPLEVPPQEMPSGAVSEGLTPVPDLPPGTPTGQQG